MNWSIWPWRRNLAAPRRFFLLAGAVVAWSAALVLILAVGLPRRADFTGQGIIGNIPVAPEIGALAPPFELFSAQGERMRLTDLRGQPVILNFWATWCEPCQIEMPILQELYAAQPISSLRILAINLGEPPNLIREWQNALGLTYDMLADERGSVARLYALRGQPSTYIIAPDGSITHIFYGPASHDALQTALADLN